MPMHRDRRAEQRPETNCKAWPGTSPQLADWDIGFRYLMKRVYTQGLTARDRSGQNRDRTDFLPPQASNRPTSVRLVIRDPVGAEPHSRVTRAARRGPAQIRANGARQPAFRSVEQRFVAHCAAPSQGRPSSLNCLTRAARTRSPRRRGHRHRAGRPRPGQPDRPQWSNRPAWMARRSAGTFPSSAGPVMFFESRTWSSVLHSSTQFWLFWLRRGFRQVW
jgi:hypothetical protein